MENQDRIKALEEWEKQVEYFHRGLISDKQLSVISKDLLNKFGLNFDQEFIKDQKETRIISNSPLYFSYHDLMVTVGEAAADIAYAEPYDKRMEKLQEFYKWEELAKIYLDAIDRGETELKWRKLIDKGHLSLYDEVVFKKNIVDEIGIEEWEKAITNHYKDMGEERVKEYVKKCEETGIYQ